MCHGGDHAHEATSRRTRRWLDRDGDRDRPLRRQRKQLDRHPGPDTPARTATPTAGTPTSPTVTPTPDATDTSVSPTITPTPGSACPSALSFEGDVNNAQLDPGWTGQGHGAGVIDRGKITVSVTGCQSATRPCGQCNVSGPIPNPDRDAGTADNQRCSNDLAVKCTSSADCGGAACKFFFGAPLALAAGGVSACVTNEVNSEITGTVNIEEGSSVSTVRLISRVFSGLEIAAPCPQCEGDPTPADGQPGGTCDNGPRQGLACDVSGTHKNSFFGSTSFECPPFPNGQIAALPINLSTSTGSVSATLSDANPPCRARPSARCFCDTCNTAAAEPCSTNADCPLSGGQPGVCGGRRCRLGPNNGAPCAVNSECPGGACSTPGQAPAPNECEDETCVATAADPNDGECAGGPVEQFCSGDASFQGCFMDAECANLNATCTILKRRPCFLDNGVVGGSVTAVGAADPPDENGVSNPTLATLFCIGPTSSSAVNAAGGIPGLARLQLGGTATQIP